MLFDNSNSLLHKASKCINSGNYSEAFHYIGKVLEKDPSNDMAFYYASLVFCETKDYYKALKYIEKAINFNPYRMEYWISIAIILGRCGNNEKAIHWFEKYLYRNPSDSQIWALKGCAFFDLKKYGNAVESFEKALKINPNSRFALDYRERALKMLESNYINTSNYGHGLGGGPWGDYTCAICGGDGRDSASKYDKTCPKCGRLVCSYCWSYEGWRCKSCR